MPDPDEVLPLEQRQLIFAALVEAQDAGAKPAASRATIAEKYEVSEDMVRDIEREGLANQWPPL
jgi:hypothetical protein